jgi:hypothetical protein
MENPNDDSLTPLQKLSEESSFPQEDSLVSLLENDKSLPSLGSWHDFTLQLAPHPYDLGTSIIVEDIIAGISTDSLWDSSKQEDESIDVSERIQFYLSSVRCLQSGEIELFAYDDGFITKSSRTFKHRTNQVFSWPTTSEIYGTLLSSEDYGDIEVMVITTPILLQGSLFYKRFPSASSKQQHLAVASPSSQ